MDEHVQFTETLYHVYTAQYELMLYAEYVTLVLYLKSSNEISGGPILAVYSFDSTHYVDDAIQRPLYQNGAPGRQRIPAVL